jgi:hypothetical protein
MQGATVCFESYAPEPFQALLYECVSHLGEVESSPMCILHDMFSTWAQVVADKLHIEKHLLFVSPVHFLASNLQV